MYLFLAMITISSLTFAQSQPTDCKTGIERCGPQVKPPSCPPGQHWSNKKTGYARCESDTPPPPGCTNGWTNYPICGPVSPPPPPPKAKIPVPRIVEFGESVPDLGIIGSRNLCNSEGYGPLLANLESVYPMNAGYFVGTGSCIGVRGNTYTAFSFVPMESGSSIFPITVLGGNGIRVAADHADWAIQCVLNEKCSSRWADPVKNLIQSKRDKLVLIINGHNLSYGDNQDAFMYYGRFVKKGELIGTFYGTDESQFGNYREVYAPSDGILFIGGSAPSEGGSAG